MTHAQVYKRHANPHSGLLLNGRERDKYREERGQRRERSALQRRRRETPVGERGS